MKKLVAMGLGLLAMVGVVLLSRPMTAGTSNPSPELQIKQEAVNPWNNLKFNNAPSTFRFAIVSDRTGGARAGIFERAVDQLNLLQPEFVVSVGDLIQGGTEDLDKINKQWNEFNGIVAKLQVPFFYVPGNHDIGNTVMEKRWQEQFGRRHYHFVYKNVLFLMLNAEDLPGKKTTGKFGPAQIADVKKILADNRDVRWTMVFLHRPFWHAKDTKVSGWNQIEEALKGCGKKCTVLAGHEHKYDRVVRNGQVYYTLATTGGGSKLRGAPFGEFDHLMWCTMKDDGPVLVNLMMEGIVPSDLKLAAKEAIEP